MIWIVYDKTRIIKNRDFVDLLIKKFKNHNIKAKLVFAENIKKYKNFPKLAIMRSDIYNVSQFLESKSVKVCNNAFINEICNDKYKTYLFLKENSIKTIPSFLYEECNKLSFPFVAKSRFGHGGSEVYKIENKNDLENIVKKYNDVHSLIFQPLVDCGKDKRTYVIGKDIIISMLRQNSKDFRANFSLGGHAEVSSLSIEEKQLINQVISALNFDFAGVDIIYSNNKPFINEIEDIVGSRMVYQYSDIDIIEKYTTYLSNIYIAL